MRNMKSDKKKIIRATTVPGSLNVFCKGMLKELSKKYEVIGISSPGEALDRVSEREGVRTIAVPMERHIALVKDFNSLMQMTRVFRKEKPFMVHSMTPKAGLICMMAGWLTHVPVRIHTFTGLVWPTSTGLKRKILMLTDKLTCACATHVIPEGEGVKIDLVTGRITKKPLRVLGYGNVMGVDLEHFMITEKLKEKSAQLKNSGVFYFLFVGRIVRDKGINELVSSFNKLQQENANIRLFLVGPYEDDLDPISEKSRELITNNPSILAVGKKTGDELLKYYCAADCFVLPSYREGFPNTVLEAGALELPSIVTDVNGSREIIINGVNGIVVPPRDEERLYEAMKMMLTSKQDRERMASVARKMISERFEQSFVRKCLYDYYDEVIEIHAKS